MLVDCHVFSYQIILSIVQNIFDGVITEAFQIKEQRETRSLSLK